MHGPEHVKFHVLTSVSLAQELCYVPCNAINSVACTFILQQSEKVISGPVVTQENLKVALKDTKPSLSDTEMLRYRLM
jgi:hypothetical protein